MHGHFEGHEITGLIFDSLSRTGVTIVTDSEDRIVAISDHYVKILNRKKKDIIGPVTFGNWNTFWRGPQISPFQDI
jgi:hypothetical protein